MSSINEESGMLIQHSDPETPITNKIKQQLCNVIEWKEEAIKGNFMPAAMKLERGDISIEEIVNPETEDRLLHLAVGYSFYNVTRTFVEIFKAGLNSKNKRGETVLHVISREKSHDVYLLSYLLKNETLMVDPVDKMGLTPIFYAVINRFNIAVLALAYLNANLGHYDKNGNSILYYAITSDNKFALKFSLEHAVSVGICDEYVNNSATLSDLLITNKNTSCSRHILKYHHRSIELDSIEKCKINLEELPCFNRFNYELMNTVYCFKGKDWLYFFKKIWTYQYKFYNISFIFYHLLLPCMSRNVKLIIVYSYAFSITYAFAYFYYFIEANSPESFQIVSLHSLITLYQLSSIFTLFFSLYKLTFLVDDRHIYEENKFSLINKLHQRETVLHAIHDAMERNPLDLPSQEEICEICLIKKSPSTNHCHTCSRCVKEFYFHSNVFSMCFNRSNVYYYILLLSSIWFMHFFLVYFYAIALRMEIAGNAISHSVVRHLYLFLTRLRLLPLVLCLVLLYSGLITFGRMVTLLICIGYKTTYYNMFRYHKKAVGQLRKIGDSYYPLTAMSSTTLWEFTKNIFSGK